MAASGGFTLEEFDSANWAMLLGGDAFVSDPSSVSGAYFAKLTRWTNSAGVEITEWRMMDDDYPVDVLSATPPKLPAAGEVLPIAQSLLKSSKGARPYLYVLPSSLVITDSSSPAPQALTPGIHYTLPPNFAWTGRVAFASLFISPGVPFVGPLKCSFSISGGSAVLPAPLVFGQPYALPDQNVTGVSIKDSAVPPATVPSSLYDYEGAFGEVTFTDKAAFNAVVPKLVQPLKVQYTFGPTEQISIMTNKTVEVSLRFKGVDLVNPGRKLLIEFFRAQLLLPKTLDLLQQQLTSGEQPFNLLPDRTKPEDNVLGRYGRIAVIPEA
ncbi:MAG: hypothetical protein EPN21_05110 [Methylococcaceae bacterium]|nr:MAG: hypothetical protein EPN21_05110 [Methylococcaceae bacterium]